MWFRRRPNPRIASAVLLLFIVLASGCASWHSIGKETPPEFIFRAKPEAVRLTLPESTLVLSVPSVRGDSILGVSRATRPPQMLAVSASNIRELKTLGAPKSAKIMLGTIGAAAVAFAILGIVFSNGARIQ